MKVDLERVMAAMVTQCGGVDSESGVGGEHG